MDKRYSSLSPRADRSRPRTHRKRSNSFPISEALGCSTPEAELILAEGRAAVRRRMTDRQLHRKRDRIETFKPKDHIGYLSSGSAVLDYRSSTQPNAAKHTRTPSTATDGSTSTVIAPAQSTTDTTPNKPIVSPLGDYSAQLANFIQSQLNSIPTYNPNISISPRSCPDLSFPRSPLRSPAFPVPARRHVGAPNLIEIPSIRPPARSAFSAWSSTDDETDDEAPPVPNDEIPRATATSTPSVLGYYEHNNGSTFLFTSTPLDDDDEPDTAKAFSFPDAPKEPELSVDPASPARDDDYTSSAFSRLSMLTSSSAPSFSSISTRSYFECKMELPQGLNLKTRALAATTPPLSKIIPSISPFEGAALSNVHDIYVHSQQRVLVDGMSFDMVRDLSTESMRRVPTPC